VGLQLRYYLLLHAVAVVQPYWLSSAAIIYYVGISILAVGTLRLGRGLPHGKTTTVMNTAPTIAARLEPASLNGEFRLQSRHSSDGHTT
jgi:hypothetical protein